MSIKTGVLIFAGLFGSTVAQAEDVSGADRVICAVTEVMMCLELGECYPILPYEIDMPEFIVIDTKKRTISTTQASGSPRSTKASTFEQEDGRIILQGLERGRAFSIMVEEDLGALTGAVARDGVSISVFGSCTDADND